MQPWEMLELQEKLEQQGDVTLPFDGEEDGALYKEGVEAVRLPGLWQYRVPPDPYQLTKEWLQNRI